MALATNEDNYDPLLTVQQLAEMESLTERQVRYLIKTCGLPCYRVNGVRVRLSEYQDWLRSRKVQ
jgi:hypothetical protein